MNSAGDLAKSYASDIIFPPVLVLQARRYFAAVNMI
jgi:hypothetical protein